MAITAAEVRKIARLARLRLGADEAALYQEQFGRILELVDELSALDASAAGSSAAGAVLPTVMRDDSPAPFAQPQLLLALAPERSGDYYKVKKVLA